MKHGNLSWIIGAPVVSQIVLGPGNDGRNNHGDCSFEGIVGEQFFNIMIGQMKKRGYSCFLEGDSDLGSFDPVNNSYSGLLGGVQKGEIDMIAMPSYYPIHDPLEDFFYSPAFHEDTMTICSSYSVNVNSTMGYLYSMFAMVPYGLWIGYVLSFFLFFMITILGSFLLRKKYSSLWVTLCAFLDQDNYPGGSMFISVLSSIVMIAMFFMMTYAGSNMSTDLVSLTDPVTITSYDEILEKNVTIVVSTNTAEHEMFRRAPKNSKEEKMFRNSMNIIISPEHTSKLAEDAVAQKIVGVMRHVIVLSGAYNMLGSLVPPNGVHEDLRTFLGADKDAKKFTNVFVVDARLVGTHKLRTISRVTQLIAEHGHYQRLLSQLPPFMSSMLNGEAIGNSPSMAAKVSSKIETQSSDVVAISWAHFSKVFYLPYQGALVAFLTLLIEINFKWKP